MISKEFEQARWSAVERVHNILSTPTTEVPNYFEVDVVRTSQQVLDCEGLTTEDVINDPTLLLRGDAYEGGATTKMDPFHPASLAMNELRFAAHASVETGHEEFLAAAVNRASDAVGAYGVPTEIAQVSTIGSNVYWFEPTEVFVLMPDCLSARGAGARRPPMNRVSATFLIMGALAGMPADHEGRPAIEQLVWFIGTPNLEPELMKAATDQVAAALLKGPHLSGDDLT